MLHTRYNLNIAIFQGGWISTTDAPDFNYADDTQWPIEIQVTLQGILQVYHVYYVSLFADLSYI